ncbi:MAG: DUF4417 domain-containing protein [Candidatus Bruticola sp.]
MKKSVVDDAFSSYLIEKAFFEGKIEMPCIAKPESIIIPEALIPFSQRRSTTTYSEFVHFYEYDEKFASVMSSTNKFLDELRRFKGVISPDCSLYTDMPLVVQMANTYLNRAVGAFFQSQGLYVIPNIRWGDERSYSPQCEKFAFLGVEKNSIVSIGTYGCIRGKENKRRFQKGLEAMLIELSPRVVVVYGAMPKDVFADYLDYADFHRFNDWISDKKGNYVRRIIADQQYFDF